MKRVAVEKSLGNVRNYLKEKGFTVTDLDQAKNYLDGFDAVVVSGQDDNFMGIHDTSTKAPVINARGMDVEDVYKQIKNRLS
ncbi:Uncharacterised protein family (UPF0180) [Geosporobacter subterraneus DSM 17957]|uniref:Uncharacterized protein family (UPF0180) n=1 Tax=Geosporobacter subterraneus DSM 17957 TaxID=1121919 RepID=A0A1M6JZQ5_9FIRM|nr:YkuS family protein [Geosporobacter subterraneus]SHJ52157.1 Uncharacterised protein family (UPF0180) [Geosporobacter subterraneus DSM 17957]